MRKYKRVRDPFDEAKIRINQYVCHLERHTGIDVCTELGLTYQAFKELRSSPTPRFFYDIYMLYHYHKIEEDDTLYDIMSYEVSKPYNHKK